MGRSKTMVGRQVAGDARTRHPVVISFLDGVYRCEGCGVEEAMDLAATVRAVMEKGDAFTVKHEGCRSRPVGMNAEEQARAEKYRFDLWEAIHAYVEACGGDTGRHHVVAKMQAVMQVERAVDAEVERRARTAPQEAAVEAGATALRLAKALRLLRAEARTAANMLAFDDRERLLGAVEEASRTLRKEAPFA